MRDRGLSPGLVKLKRGSMKTRLNKLERIQQERLNDPHFKVLVIHLMDHYLSVILGCLITKCIFPTLNAYNRIFYSLCDSGEAK